MTKFQSTPKLLDYIHVNVVKHLFKNVSEIDIKELKRNMVSQDTGMLTADYRSVKAHVFFEMKRIVVSK